MSSRPNWPLWLKRPRASVVGRAVESPPRASAAASSLSPPEDLQLRRPRSPPPTKRPFTALACQSPSYHRRSAPLRVSLSIESEAAPLSTVADYCPTSNSEAGRQGQKFICAGAMVYNLSKFPPDWVVYHVGVERCFLYDNGREDELDSAASRLGVVGFNTSTRFWPWVGSEQPNRIMVWVKWRLNILNSGNILKFILNLKVFLKNR